MCREQQQQQLVHGILVLRKKTKKKNSREKVCVSERLFHICCKRLSLSLSLSLSLRKYTQKSVDLSNRQNLEFVLEQLHRH
jgi:hypothetical protein